MRVKSLRNVYFFIGPERKDLVVGENELDDQIHSCEAFQKLLDDGVAFIIGDAPELQEDNPDTSANSDQADADLTPEEKAAKIQEALSKGKKGK